MLLLLLLAFSEQWPYTNFRAGKRRCDEEGGAAICQGVSLLFRQTYCVTLGNLCNIFKPHYFSNKNNNRILCSILREKEGSSYEGFSTVPGIM